MQSQRLISNINNTHALTHTHKPTATTRLTSPSIPPFVWYLAGSYGYGLWNVNEHIVIGIVDVVVVDDGDDDDVICEIMHRCNANITNLTDQCNRPHDLK